MRISIIIACLIISGVHNSAEAQSPLPLSRNPAKSEITLYSGPDTIIGALLLLKDSSILVSNSFLKEDYMNGNYEIAELYIDEINLISPKRRVGPFGRACLGALVGVGVGALTARLVEGPPPDPVPSDLYWGRPDYGDYSPNYAEFIFAGALLGATTGIIMGISIKIPVNGSMENYNRKKKKLGRYTVKYSGAPAY